SGANVGASERPSATTALTGRPSTPPSWLTSSTANRTASTTGASLPDMVPLSEWSTPTLIGSPPGTPWEDFCHGRQTATASPSSATRNSPATAQGRRRRPDGGAPVEAAGAAGTAPLWLGRTIGVCPERVAATACKSAIMASAAGYRSAGAFAAARQTLPHPAP